MDIIVESMLTFQLYLKTYHWQTKSHSRHKASDKLYSEINDSIDLFVETLQGKMGGRVKLTGTLQFRNFTETQGQKLLQTFRNWLEKDLEKLLKRKLKAIDDLLNIRDEMVASINQTLYLFSQK